ncbi:MAG: AI-2E family transporter [Oscillospiraceae bacterium]|nr:AI-2E family transporter [Oscillospiraceae bacterium]
MAFVRKILPVAVGAVCVWLGLKYLLPVALPFLLGAALALAAEPLVGRMAGRLPRGVSAGFGVTVTLVAVAVLVYFAGMVAFRQLKKLTGLMPDLQNAATQATQLAQDFFIQLSDRAPEEVRPMLQKTVLAFFDNGTVLVQQLTQRIPGFVGSTLTRVGDGAVGVGTGVLSAFLISARLPQLKEALKSRLPQLGENAVFSRIKKGLGGWLKAQLKLTAITAIILLVGFWVLRIPHAPMWAALVALVDAVPILGTGTVLLPWALVCFLQKQTLQGIGLLCVYGASFLTRTVLEPRLVGKQLGLDPLLTLMALYLGYRFWGIPGMLLAPILASATANLFRG